MNALKKFILLLSPSEKKRAIFLTLMLLMVSILEMMGVASILPFMAVVVDPGIIESNKFINELFKSSGYIGVESEKEFLFFLGISVFFILVISILVKAYTNYLQIYFTQMCQHNLGKKLASTYLQQSYEWFLNQNSAELVKSILSEVGHVIFNGLNSLMNLIAHGMVIISIITLLFVVNPKITIIISLFIGGSYIAIFIFTRNYLNSIGKRRLESNNLRYQTLNEAFNGSKEIKLSGFENYFVDRFSKHSMSYAKTTAASMLVKQMPRYLLEIIVFGGVMIAIIYLIAYVGNFISFIPIFTFYVLAGYRLMPAFQQIYSSISQLSFVGPSLDKIFWDIKNLKLHSNYQNENKDFILFKKKISLKKISFKYPISPKNILHNINIDIPYKNSIGIFGSTGSGKTTLIDIVLGLLQLKTGTLEVDNQLITKKNLKSWQRSIGYVSQNFFLLDDTLEANIAFGIDNSKINHELVLRAAKNANLHDFISTKLPQKYKTIIGERGVRLSGGQRQRIVIARALYHNPKVLILDEATSALDNETESVIMDFFQKLKKDTTIILVAHRLNTLKYCDIIYKLEDGNIVKQGKFHEIFKQMR